MPRTSKHLQDFCWTPWATAEALRDFHKHLAFTALVHFCWLWAVVIRLGLKHRMLQTLLAFDLFTTAVTRGAGTNLAFSFCLSMQRDCLSAEFLYIRLIVRLFLKSH